MSTPRLGAAVFVWLASFIACSSLNREGPSTTCAALKNGAVNACEQGIIASCDDGTHVTYRVCTDGDGNGVAAKDICDALWQQAGAFRCSSSEPLPQ